MKDFNANNTYAICFLSLISVKEDPFDQSEQITQLLYGEEVEIIKEKQNWFYIRTVLGKTEGWILKNQVRISNKHSNHTDKPKIWLYSMDFISLVSLDENNIEKKMILLGSILNNCTVLKETYQGKNKLWNSSFNKQKIESYSNKYLGVPYLYGGQSIFGIDSLGLCQMIYRFLGIDLPRHWQGQKDAGEQVDISDIEIGDLVFFKSSDSYGRETLHSGMVYNAQYMAVIHSYGQVRLDSLSSEGLFDIDTKQKLFDLDYIIRIEKNKG